MGHVLSERPIPATARDLDRRYFQPEIETMFRAELRSMQERRVLELVPLAYEKSAFYRELWSASGVDPRQVRTLADFTRLIPTFTKGDLRDYRERTGDPYSGLLQVPPDQLTTVMSTSGTTGDPELLPEIWNTAAPTPVCSSRDLWELGLPPGDRVLVPPGTFRGFYDSFYQEMGLVPIYVDTWIGHGEECPHRVGLHVEPAEWRIGDGPAGLTISTVGDRAYRAIDVPVGVTGHVHDKPCACGLPGPRIRLNDLT